MVVYLMTLFVSGAMVARALVMSPEDCTRLAQRLGAHAVGEQRYTCEGLPLYLNAFGPPPQIPPPPPKFFPAPPAPLAPSD